ncbi:hypothetical protein SO802_029296 [Lithocarpus litseifolius]|uniref:2-oxoacid dehydrogenase acyltransferase catalytic domain-containing protein n=1 Tax=Lithocarpus litseifolius TaxID=425828 RepID=A0AAW2BV97_9ROSI
MEELDANWFPPAEASLKRTLIQKLIFVLLKNRSLEVSSAACSDEDGPSEFPENNKCETGVEFLSQRCSPAIAPQGNLSSSQADQRIEMTVLSVSSISSQCVNGTSLVPKEFLESGATAGSLPRRLPSFDHPSSYYHLNGTFSLSNLGMFGVDRFDAILPPGTGAIMAVGASQPTVVATKDGKCYGRSSCNVKWPSKRLILILLEYTKGLWLRRLMERNLEANHSVQKLEQNFEEQDKVHSSIKSCRSTVHQSVYLVLLARRGGNHGIPASEIGNAVPLRLRIFASMGSLLGSSYDSRSVYVSSNQNWVLIVLRKKVEFINEEAKGTDFTVKDFNQKFEL